MKKTLIVLPLVLLLGGGFYYYQETAPIRAGDAIEECSDLGDCDVPDAESLARLSCEEGDGRGCLMLYGYYFEKYNEVEKDSKMTRDKHLTVLRHLTMASRYADLACKKVGGATVCRLSKVVQEGYSGELTKHVQYK
jgi:hypothetical protein